MKSPGKCNGPDRCRNTSQGLGDYLQEQVIPVNNSIARTTDTLTDWLESEAWDTDTDGSRYRFTYGPGSRFEDGCYTIDVLMKRYELVDPDGRKVDERSVLIGEVSFSAGQARELANLLLQLAEAVER
jgi:hypothetical protein